MNQFRLGIFSGLRMAHSSFVITKKILEICKDSIQGNFVEKTPVRLRELFEELGATYIKLGQFIASTPSLFPKAYVREMEKCLDQIKPISENLIIQTIEKELGDKIENIYSYFDPIPLASASIAQVHSAKTKNGEDIVIKVQRPDIENTLHIDMGILNAILNLCSFLFPHLKSSGLMDIFLDFKKSILEEINFVKEGENIQEFSEYLKTLGIRSAIVPKTYPELSKNKVLTMERFYGYQITDLDNLRKITDDPKKTLMGILEVWFQVLNSFGFFHADVHSGNLMILQDGRIGFLDFGIIGRISQSVKVGLLFFLDGLQTQEASKMAKGLVLMDSTKKEVNEEQLTRDIEKLFQEISSVIEKFIFQSIGEYDESSLEQLFLHLRKITSDNGLKIPREFGLLLKQFVYFDKYLQMLAPNINLVRDRGIFLN